jgi:hypothetical protein
MLIGISVSSCIHSIALGCISSHNVSKIIGATSARTPEEWEDVIERYKKLYWSKCADKAEAIIREFLAAGKIEQPMLTTGLAPLRNKGIWVVSESEITWG